MQRRKRLNKATLALIILFLLNVLAFGVINSSVKQTKEEVAEIMSNPDNDTYFRSGVNILSWSYSLLKYYRQ